ncbi:MAG: hypothetical protein ACTHJ6_13650, partial [Oryzihumus sp.]
MSLVAYAVGQATSSSGGTSPMAVSNNVPVGDTIIVSAVNQTLAGAITGVSDGKNTYTKQVVYNAAGSFFIEQWIAPCTTALTVGVDTITVSWNGSQTNVRINTIGVPGLVTASPYDTNGFSAANGTGAAPNSGSSGTLSQTDEVAVGVIVNGNGGGTPAWNSPWSNIQTVHTGTTFYTSVAIYETGTTSPVAAQATVASSTWTAMVTTYKVLPNVAALAAAPALTAGAGVTGDYLYNTAEGGTSGTTVTSANSGASSGHAFDSITMGSGATLTFDGTHANRGSLAYSYSTGATGVL